MDRETVDPDEDSSSTKTHTIAVYDGTQWFELNAEHGRTLREVLRDHDLSPHNWLTQYLNCDGQGHCAACSVDIEDGEPAPDQWLDAFLDSQDAGRLSCQMDVTSDMTIRID
jgi:ferredoxin